MSRAPTDTREKLLKTAIDLIWKNSYGSVTVDHICHAAGVQKGSFYHFFPSKMALTLSALDHFFEESEPLFDFIFDPNISPKERFIRLCEFGYEGQKQNQQKYGRVCGCPFMSLGTEMAGQEKAIKDKTKKVFKKHEAYYQMAIEDMIILGELPQHINANQMAKKIYAYVMGCLMMARIQNSLIPLQENLKTGIFDILTINQEKIENA